MIGWLGLLVVVFASYRLTRIVTTDTITTNLRDRLFRWAWSDSEADGAVRRRVSDTEDEIIPAARAPWRTYVNELVTCPWCFGVWVSAAVYSLWRWVDWMPLHAALVILAVAGAQGFLASREGD